MRRKFLLLTITAAAVGLTLSAQIPDFKPPTPLFAAILKKDPAAAKKLLENGADPNEGRFLGYAPLHMALMDTNPAIARALLSRGADAKAVDGNGSTPLMWAAANDVPNREIIESIVKKGGADPNAVNKQNESALTWAMRRGDLDTVAQLKALGATDAAAIRSSVERAVASLQKSGPQFVKVSGCVSCHHQSVPQIAYAAARERGFQIDEAVSAQQVKAVMSLVKPIREPLEKGLIDLPNPPVSVGYLLLGIAAEGYARDEYTAAAVKAIERTQLEDGSFNVLAARPPFESSQFTGTALAIRALQLYGNNAEDPISRARQWLERTKPLTQEDRAMRLLGLAWAKADAKIVDQAAADLAAAQRADGGWSQLADIEADAYATGQAMYALDQAGPAYQQRYKQAIDRASVYLLRTQLADGTWLVRTRANPVQVLKESGFPHGRDQWISAAGTAWAATALALTQPPAQQQAVSSAAVVR